MRNSCQAGCASAASYEHEDINVQGAGFHPDPRAVPNARPIDPMWFQHLGDSCPIRILCPVAPKTRRESQEELYAQCGYNTAAIVETAVELVGAQQAGRNAAAGPRLA